MCLLAYLPINILVLALWDTQVRACLGDVHLILLHRSMVGMMAMVRDAPREEGSPHKGVGDESDDIAYGAVGGESTMAGLDNNDNDKGRNTGCDVERYIRQYRKPRERKIVNLRTSWPMTQMPVKLRPWNHQ